MLVVLLNIPAVQRSVASSISDALSNKLGTEVTIKNVDLGIINRIIIDNVSINDQSNKEMLQISRAAAKISLYDLVKGRINVSSAQLFGLKANLYKENNDSQTNFQFLIDSLSTKDDSKKTPLNLNISSLIIRRSEVQYHVLSAPRENKFSAKHLNLSNISAHLILNIQNSGSINLNIKKLSLKEESGLDIKRFNAKCALSKNNCSFEELLIELPNSRIAIPEFTVSNFNSTPKFDITKSYINGRIDIPSLTLSDLGCFAKVLKNYEDPVSASANIKGKDNIIHITDVIIKQNNDVNIHCDADIKDALGNPDVDIHLRELKTSSDGVHSVLSNLQLDNSLPSFIGNIGNIFTQGILSYSNIQQAVKLECTTDIGNVNIDIAKKADNVKAKVETNQLRLDKITENASLGALTSIIEADGLIAGNKIISGKANATIQEIAYNNHIYNNVTASSELNANHLLSAIVNIVDEDCNVDLHADYDLAAKQPKGNFNALVTNLNPNRLSLTDKWPDTTFSFETNGKFTGKDINSLNGDIDIKNFVMSSPENHYAFTTASLHKSLVSNTLQRVILKSDFASLRAEGEVDFNTLLASLSNAIQYRLPTLPGLKKQPEANNKVKLYGTITDTDLVATLFDVPLKINEPIHIITDIDDKNHIFNINLDAQDFVYSGNRYTDGFIVLSSQNDSLKARINIGQVSNEGTENKFHINASAADNRLTTSVNVLSLGSHHIEGKCNASASFFTNEYGESEADITITPSEIQVADTTWHVTPSHIKYFKNHLQVDNFALRHGNQHIIINGTATDNYDDEIEVDLKDVNVAYILDLVNFHSVEFAGNATGKAKARALFSKPEAEAHLNVGGFCFESGYMGTLIADADWNFDQGAININGIVIDDENQSIVRGYVSPKNNDINLYVHADGIRVGFVEKYTSTFLRNLDARAWGKIQIVGPLNCIQLVGDAIADGSVDLIPLNTSYTLHQGHITLAPDNIHFDNDTIYDREGHLGILSGDLFHKHLGHFTYNIDVAAHNILALDIPDFDDDVFCGTVYASGTCNIHDENGDVFIDVNATPEQGSTISYNAASPDAITNREFIHWHDKNAIVKTKSDDDTETKKSTRQSASDLYMNLLIHCNPNATLKVLMDQVTGDYIALQGNGVIRASYYNKGRFDLFGNYVVNSGTYTLTVQNVLKRVFEFQPGGTIAFGGDAYNAGLDLQAHYTVNGVSLSDINIGKSFTNNQVRVNCLMNISGTPGQPHVDFSLDIPSLSTEAQQMIMRLMDSEEAVNQQVLYLLAIGRFFYQDNNSSFNDMSRQSQTSLAMQSILSGTLSQQLSNVLSSVVNNNNWNLGANISTGDEGFNNAEYEGLLSGRLLNNRLLFDGQFGYRDNQNATSSFIGDFDIRYLLIPNGNAALKVYNQTNDKYFTKNSLTTQGIGIILKKDFGKLNELMFWKKKK